MRLAALLAVLAVAGTAAAESPDASQRNMRLGQSIVLRSGDPPVRLRIALLDYRDEVRSPYYRPPRGQKFVAFRLRISNLSRRNWIGTLASWAELVDSKGRTYSVLGRVGRPWPVLAPTLNNGSTIRPRHTLTGYLGWLLPKRVELRTFRYSFGLSPVAGVWALPRR